MKSKNKSFLYKNKNLIFIAIFLLICYIIYYVYRYVNRSELSLIQSDIVNNYYDLKNDLLQRISVDNKINDVTGSNPRVDTASQKRALFELYYSGVPDKYDISGTKLQGISPDVNKALKTLEDIIKDPTNRNVTKDIQKLGFMYRYGIYDMKPDHKKAVEALTKYRKFIKDPYSQQLITQDIQNILKEQDNDVIDISTIEIPDVDNDTININDILPDIQQQHYDLNNPFQQDIIIGFNNINNNNNNIRNTRIIRNDIPSGYLDHIDILEQQRLLDRFNAQRDQNRIYNDPQNVHDPLVIETVKNSIINLKNQEKLDPQIKDKNKSKNTKQEILKYLREKPRSDKRNDAIRALNDIYDKNSFHSTFNISEVDALDIVYNKIKNNDIAKEILYNELASMIENNILVCSTGRVARIIDTINIANTSNDISNNNINNLQSENANQDVKIIPEFVLNQEMLDKSSILRKQFYDKYNDNNQILDPSLQQNNQESQFVSNSQLLDQGKHPNQDTIDIDLKKYIKDSLKKDYVDTNIIKEDQFNNILNKWINEI